MFTPPPTPAGTTSSLSAGGDQLSAMTKLLESGLPRLAQAQPDAAAKLLPRVVHLLVPLLSAEQDGVRFNTSGALQSLVKECLTPQLVTAMQQQQPHQRMPPLQSLVAAVASSLGARYQEAWSLALPGKCSTHGLNGCPHAFGNPGSIWHDSRLALSSD